MIVRWWRRLRDTWIERRTWAAVAERECGHDGSHPRCVECDRGTSGW